MLNRRELLVQSALATSTVVALPTLSFTQEKKAAGFMLDPLPYAKDALEPHIDAMTMEIHHDRHHKAYVDNLNKALAGTDWATWSITDVVKNIKKAPEKIQTAVRNNGGGHYNHTLFWKLMTKKSAGPSKDVADAMKAAFGGMDGFKKLFKDAAMSRFGSGWAWLVVSEGKLKIVSTPNQDNPLMDGSGIPILGIDVWEHAYYLKYQNKRADYVDAWFNVVNWEYVAELHTAAKKG